MVLAGTEAPDEASPHCPGCLGDVTLCVWLLPCHWRKVQQEAGFDGQQGVHEMRRYFGLQGHWRWVSVYFTAERSLCQMWMDLSVTLTGVKNIKQLSLPQSDAGDHAHT